MWLYVQLSWTVQLYSVLISYLKFKCCRVFKINTHRFNSYIFSIILFEFKYTFRLFFFLGV